MFKNSHLKQDDDRVAHIFERLSDDFKDAKIELIYQTPYQLLIAVVLSAQTTDRAVNKVTQHLFQTVKTPEDLLLLSQEEIEKKIASIGLYRTKAKSIKQLSQQLVDRHNSEIPSKYEDLIALSGVGRKTAHVVMNELYDYPVIAVDTHVFRVSQRLQLSSERSRDAVGDDLMKKIPEHHQKRAHHYLIFLGRRLCKAKKPLCEKCCLKDLCNYSKNNLLY